MYRSLLAIMYAGIFTFNPSGLSVAADDEEDVSRSIAKPDLSPFKVLPQTPLSKKPIDDPSPSRIKKNVLVKRGEVGYVPLPVGHATGFLGEQHWPLWAKSIEPGDLLAGPSGAGGKSMSASGFDAVWLTKKGDLWVADNKAGGDPGRKIGPNDATALTKNLLRSLKTAVADVKNGSHPQKEYAAEQLDKAVKILEQRKGTWPSKVKVMVTTVGGYQHELTEDMATIGKKLYNVDIPIEIRQSLSQEEILARAKQVQNARQAGNTPGSLLGTAQVAKAVTAEAAPQTALSRAGKAFRSIDPQGHLLLFEYLKKGIIFTLEKTVGTRAERDLSQTWPHIQSHLENNPDDGVLVEYDFRYSDYPVVELDGRVVPMEPTEWKITGRIDAQYSYHGLTYRFGKTPEDAYQQLLKRSFLSPPVQYGKILQFQRPQYIWYQNGTAKKITPALPSNKVLKMPTPK